MLNVADGTWTSMDTGILLGKNGAMTVVEGTDGTQALIVYSGYPVQNTDTWENDTYYRLDAYELDAVGAPVVASQVNYAMDLAPGGMYRPGWGARPLGYAPGVAFIPLGSGDVIPEPATMLLVGTGLLSLVGIIRRRRLH